MSLNKKFTGRKPALPLCSTAAFVWVNAGLFFLFDRADCQGEVTDTAAEHRLIGKYL